VTKLMSIVVVLSGVKSHHPPSSIKKILETLLGVTFNSTTDRK